MDVRAPVALTLLAVLGAGLWWVAALAPGGEAGPAAIDVVVVAPDGSVFASGTVDVARSTALAGLLALAEARGFEVGHERLGAFGGCSQEYVRSIGPFAETSTGGWNYYTRSRSSGGGWTWQPAGADCALPAGVELEWCWVELDVCRHHAA